MTFDAADQHHRRRWALAAIALIALAVPPALYAHRARVDHERAAAQLRAGHARCWCPP